MSRCPVIKALDPGWTKRLNSLYVSTEGKLIIAIKTSLALAQNNIKLDALASAIEQGRLADALRATKTDDVFLASDAIQQELEAAMIAAADFDLAAIETTTGRVLNPLAPRLKKRLEMYTARRIKAIDDTTRETVRQLIAEAVKTGRHPYQTAKDIKQHVGMTPRQSQAAERLRKTLEKAGQPLDAVTRKVDAFIKRQVEARAENIARTETMQAINGARQELRMQLVEQGALPEGQTHTWRTARDERVCPVCGPLDGTSLPLGETWPGTEVDTAPAHPQCRCVCTLDNMPDELEGDQ